MKTTILFYIAARVTPEPFWKGVFAVLTVGSAFFCLSNFYIAAFNKERERLRQAGTIRRFF